jgi:glycosyltransferase involved in cell wall biosynthesis
VSGGRATARPWGVAVTHNAVAMKPLLFSILPRPPHPTRDGLAIRNYHLLAALEEHFRVRAFSLLDPERAYGGGELPRGVEIEWISQPPRRLRRAWAAAASLAGSDAYSERLYRSRALSRRVAAGVAAERPCWVVAHSYHVAPAALAAGPPVWIDFHNLDSEIWRRTGEGSEGGAAAWFARLQAPRVRRLESALARRAAGLSCVSRRDAEALRAIGAAAEPMVVANGVDLSRYRMRADSPEHEVVFFVGDLSWPPNADAVRWLREKVWPELKRARPAARVEILGRDAPADVLGFAAPDWTLLGGGADTRPHWARAAVAVVPLVAGGGTRLKILEAAASGVPVVSTPIGAEGLEFAPGTEILLREDAAGFAQAVAGLLADRAAARRQAVAARARVEALYDWERIGEEFARELAGRAARRA